MDTAKIKIKECVELYIRLMPEEYKAFLEQMVQVRRQLLDDKFGQALGQGTEMRALFEMPESLHHLLTTKLTLEELQWLKEGGTDKKAGARWFAKTFPAFRLIRTI